MQASDFRNDLHEEKVIAEVNQRYYQSMQRRWWLWDKSAKITVAVVALFALLAVFLPHELKWLEITVATIAALAAVVLNVIPVGEWATESGEMFRSWSDLLQTIDKLELKAHKLTEGESATEDLAERLEEVSGRSLQLDAMESAPDERLLAKCQGDVNERMYGKGIRTYRQAMESLSNQEEEVSQHA